MDWIIDLYENKREDFAFLVTVAIVVIGYLVITTRLMIYDKKMYDEVHYSKNVYKSNIDFTYGFGAILAIFVATPILLFVVAFAVGAKGIYKYPHHRPTPPKRESLVEPTPKPKQRDTVYIFVQPKQELKSKTTTTIIKEEYK